MAGRKSAASAATRRERHRNAPASDKRTASSTGGLLFGLTLFIADLLCQIALIGLGAYIVLGDVEAPLEESHVSVVNYLMTWCVFGTLYWIVTVTAGFISSRRQPLPRGTRAPDRPMQRFIDWLELHPIVGVIRAIATFLASFIGLTAAVELLVLRNDPDWGFLIQIVAVWAMLLSWALFHWGYANLYARAYRRAKTIKPLDFPGDDEPGLADFVYFAFTTAVAFSTSDVSVMTRRMRWTVIWHSTLSFFFNALIIVLAINTLIQN